MPLDLINGKTDVEGALSLNHYAKLVLIGNN